MKVRDRLQQLKKDNYIIKHKLFPEGINLEEYDWLRVYKSKGNGCIDEMIYGIDVKDIDDVPEDILNIEYDNEGSYFIGGTLTLDMVLKMEENV